MSSYIIDTFDVSLSSAPQASDIVAQFVSVDFSVNPPLVTPVAYPQGAPSINIDVHSDLSGNKNGRYTIKAARSVPSPYGRWIVTDGQIGGAVATIDVAAGGTALQQDNIIQTPNGTTDWYYAFGQATVYARGNVNSISSSDSCMLFVPLLSCIDNLDGLPRDATSNSVHIAMVTSAPQSGDWRIASWQPYTGNGEPGDPAMFVQYPIGPICSNSLQPGIYNVFVQTNGIIVQTGTLTVS